MKLLILGHTGYLGSFLYEHLSKKYQVDTLVEKSGKYDYIINCIGKPDLEFCEKNPDISTFLNPGI